jgi:hypothetical protein
VTFLQASDFAAKSEFLRNETDSQSVAGKLIELGILVPGPSRLYRLDFTPDSALLDLPTQCFTQRPGPILGLTEQDFTAQLHKDDSLYNELFWPVLDAMDLGRISANDVPPFLLEVARSN